MYVNIYKSINININVHFFIQQHFLSFPWHPRASLTPWTIPTAHPLRVLPEQDTPASRGDFGGILGGILTLQQLCMPPAHPRIRMRRMAGIWIPNVQPAGNVIAVPGKGQAETATGTERESCQRRRPAGVCSPLTTRRSPGLVRNC